MTSIAHDERRCAALDPDAAALGNAGVAVDHTNYDGMIHDFANMRRLADPFPNVEAAADVRKHAGEALRETFE